MAAPRLAAGLAASLAPVACAACAACAAAQALPHASTVTHADAGGLELVTALVGAAGLHYPFPMQRCSWCGTDPLYTTYHDLEWGNPLHDEDLHFEFLLLETQQAGLSWITILRKREAYRAAFRGFDPVRVASLVSDDIDVLMQNAGIVRNRRKLEASVHNARCFLDVAREFGSFDAYIWHFTGGEPIVNRWTSMSELPVTTPLSDRVSADMKARGFKFVGSTTIYAHLQAIGIVNDHLLSCFRHPHNAPSIHSSIPPSKPASIPKSNPHDNPTAPNDGTNT